VDPRSCKADEFVRFLQEDVIPFVSSEYRVDPEDRCLQGASLGGLLGLYALFCHTDIFNRYIIGSPTVLKADHEVFQCERDYAQCHSDLTGTVFSSAGSLEDDGTLDNTLRLDETLRGRAHDGLRLKTYVFDGETHLSVFPHFGGRSGIAPSPSTCVTARRQLRGKDG
jgi:predicted alpha/beta superfamily hydrolase